jgi:hypothetical protein
LRKAVTRENQRRKAVQTTLNTPGRRLNRSGSTLKPIGKELELIGEARETEVNAERN